MLDKSVPYYGVMMVKTDTSRYPRYELPEGYSLSGYKVGFENEWAALTYSVEQTDSLEEARQIYANEFLTRVELLPKRSLFVLDKDGRVAACGSLWFGSHFGVELPRIHHVAAHREHQGKGLVKALMTTLLDTYNELGYRNFIYLTSQTWSYKALYIYSKCGFLPYKGDKPVNWKADNFEDDNARAWAIIGGKIHEYEEAKAKK